MKIDLFGMGTQSQSRAITAQRRINCFLEPRQEFEKTNLAIVGLPAPSKWAAYNNGPTRGMWAVESLGLLFFVQWNELVYVSYLDTSTINGLGYINTVSGNVSFADDGKYLMLVDGVNGWYYDMQTPGTLTKITDGNFTKTPTTVTWQDTYFIVSSASITRQFQLSANAAPATWPATSINFGSSGGGPLQACIADHSVINIFGDTYTEFYQNTGATGFPLSKVVSSTLEFGLAAAWSMAKFDNSLAGLFKDKNGNIIVGRLNGFSLQKISDGDIDTILQGYVQDGTDISDAQGYSFAISGHSFYVLNMPTAERTLMYDARSQAWSEIESLDGSYFHEGVKCATLKGQTLLGADNDATIFKLEPGQFYKQDNSSAAVIPGQTPWPMELISKHLWQDDKYIAINQIQIDMEQGVGLIPPITMNSYSDPVSAGDDPQIQLSVSKDGGNSFFSVGYSKIGAQGQYTQRVIYSQLGAARDWVLKLRITDPVKRVITGATGEITVNAF